MFGTASDFWHRFFENRTAVVCLAVTILFVLAGLFAPILAPTDPYDVESLRLEDSLRPMGTTQAGEPEERRHTFTVSGAELTAEPPFEDGLYRVAPCGSACLAFTVEKQAYSVTRLEVRDLPQGMSVMGARKHPVRNWWTVRTPRNDTVEIMSDAPLPVTFSFDAVITKAGPGSGLIFFLGTDTLGRDMVSAILYGIRISIFVGLVGAGIAMVIGTVLGLLAAWFGGFVDTITMRTVDFMLGFPALLIGLVVLAVLGNGIEKIIFAIVLVQWAYYARTARSVALVELNKEYVEAARCLRLSPMRILMRHVLPNCMPPLIVLFTLNIAAAISIEASLSFLGMGLPLTEPSLGMLIANGYELIFSNKYWVSFFPGLVLLVMIVAMNLLGDRLRDLNNPRLKT
ncbi:MAG: ABC transporter permease [Pseudomonadota bacterium]